MSHGERRRAGQRSAEGESPPRTVEGTITSVRKHNGVAPPDLAGRSVKLKVIKRADRSKDAVQALPCIPDHVTPPSYRASHEVPHEAHEAPNEASHEVEVLHEAAREAFHPPPAPIISLTKEEDASDVLPVEQEDTDQVDELRDIEQGLNKPKPASLTLIDSQDTERPVMPTPTDPEWANMMIKVLEKLHSHQKFRKTALRARRRYKSNWWLAFRLSFWMLVIGGPVIVYPVAEFFNTWGDRSSKYMASFGVAMQNFCYLLGPSLGASVRYSLEGFIGTMLALGNVLLMNRAFGSYLKGGAFATRQEVTDLALGRIIYASEWLPLCNLGSGERFVQTNSTAEFLRECFMNVHWSAVDEGSLRALIILGDLALFTGIFLYIGFGTCVRVYALIYVLYWAMAFVDPSSPAFSNDPSDPWTQSIMTCAGGFIAVLSQLLPCPNDALSKATKSSTELAETLSAVLEALPFATTPEVNLAIQPLSYTNTNTIVLKFC